MGGVLIYFIAFVTATVNDRIDTIILDISEF